MKKVICILMLFFVLTLSSCSHIEDTNGPDDYSLSILTDDDIINKKGSTVTVGTVESHSKIGNKATGKYTASKISGVTTIAEYSSSSSFISFEISFECAEGNGLIAIVTNGAIVKKVNPNETVSFTLNNSGYKYMIVVAGESAKIKINYVINS